MNLEIENILKKFDRDDVKTFDERDLNSELNRISGLSQSDLLIDELAELMAFGFCEDYPDKKTGWGTYFGPMTVIPNSDGTVRESPSIRLVTSEMLDYWLKRASISNNPILAARYSGLVWDFSSYVTNSKPSIDTATIYINAVIRIANEGFYKIDLYVFTKLKRALSIAILINNNELIERCKQAIIVFEKNVAKDELPGLWGHSFELLVFNKKAQLSEKEETEIIQDLEAKFQRLLSVEPPLINNIWPARNAATKLADYYRKKSLRNEVERVIIKFAVSSEAAHNNSEVMQVAANLEDIYRLLVRYGLKSQAGEMLLKVRDASTKVPAEMKKVGAEINIPTEKVREYLDNMTAGGLAEGLYKLLITYIPIRETAESQLRSKASKHPISYLFSQQIVDSKGRVVTTIDPLEQDFEGHLVKDIALNLHIQSITLRLLIDELIEKFGLNATDILATLKDCPIFEGDRLKIIEKALDAYFASDFVTFIHLVIPQIEEGVRNIIEAAGGNVLKESRGGGFHLRTFDDILRDEIITDSLGPELVSYFKILFTDQRGWNLRNDVCHGMTNFDAFNYQMADRVLHALLCLSLIKIVE